MSKHSKPFKLSVVEVLREPERSIPKPSKALSKHGSIGPRYSSEPKPVLKWEFPKIRGTLSGVFILLLRYYIRVPYFRKLPNVEASGPKHQTIRGFCAILSLGECQGPKLEPRISKRKTKTPLNHLRDLWYVFSFRDLTGPCTDVEQISALQTPLLSYCTGTWTLKSNNTSSIRTKLTKPS